MSFERKGTSALAVGRKGLEGWWSTFFIHFLSSQNCINPCFIAGWLKCQGKPHFTKVNGEVLGEASLPVALGGRVSWGLGRPVARFDKGVWTQVSDYELAAKKAKRGETDDCEDNDWKHMIYNMSRNTQIDLNLLVHFTMLMDLSPRHSMFAVVIPVSRISGGIRMSSTINELIAALLNRDDWLDILVQNINPVTGPLRLKLEVVLLRRVSEPNLFLTVLQSSKSALSNSLVTHIACQGLRGYKRSES